MTPKQFTWARVLALALLCAVLACLLLPTLFRLDAYLYDAGLTARPARVPDAMYIVGIDEAFMAGRPPSLTPRDKLAKVLNALAMFKPRAVAVDVVLDSRIDDSPHGVDVQLRNALRALAKGGTTVILSDVPPEDSNFTNSNLEGMTARGTALPFFTSGLQRGNVLQDVDPDGVVRDLRKASAFPPAPLELIVKDLDDPERQELEQRLRDESIPVNYCGPSSTIPVVPASDLLNQPMIAGLFSDAIVFIGATYPRSRDYVLSPYPNPKTKAKGQPIYGIEVLAQATNTLREGARRHSHLTPTAQIQDFILLTILTVAVLAIALRGTVFGIASAIVVLAAAAGTAVLSALVAPDPSTLAALLGHRFHPAAAYFIAIPLAAGLGIGWHQLEQARELRLVRDTFAAYVGDEVLEELGGQMPKLGGEVRNIAVLFCDIRGYSALAEKMRDHPEALMTELNNHFQPLVNALKQRGAYVDNYVGDLVMALFGAPVRRGDSGVETRLAVRAALDFVRLVDERNRQRVAEGLPAIEIGVGVHCGQAVVGNLGSLDPSAGGKIHYTAIGDAVNLASRVESTTRKFDVPLLVTEEAVEQCRKKPDNEDIDLPEWEFVAETTVKGRETPVRLYRPIT